MRFKQWEGFRSWPANFYLLPKKTPFMITEIVNYDVSFVIFVIDGLKDSCLNVDGIRLAGLDLISYENKCMSEK